MDRADGMPAPADVTQVPDQELIRYHCENHKDKDIADELWRRCSETLHKSLKQLVFSRNSLCPDSCGRKTFLDSTFSRVYLNFFARICGFRELDSPHSLKAWLGRVARSTALDEYRCITRSRSEIVELGLGEVSPDDTGGDSGESSSEQPPKGPFRTRLLSFYGRAQKIPPPDAAIKDEERKFLVKELLVRYSVVSDEKAHCARLIRLHYFKEWEVSKIVNYVYGTPASTRQEQTWTRYVYRELADDYAELRPFLASEFGITTLWQV